MIQTRTESEFPKRGKVGLQADGFVGVRADEQGNRLAMRKKVGSQTEGKSVKGVLEVCRFGQNKEK